MADETWEVVSETPVGGGDWEVLSEKPIQRRSLGERVSSNLRSSVSENSVLASYRNPFLNPVETLTKPLRFVMQYAGGPPQKMAETTPDFLSGFGAAGEGIRTGLALTGALSDAMKPGSLKAKRDAEVAARKKYDEQGAADPFYAVPGAGNKMLAGGATLLGQLLGGATDPTNLIGGGSTLARRAALAGATNAASDYITQQQDVQAGVREKYSPGQTAAAAALGPVLQVGVEGAAKGAGKLAKAAKNAGEWVIESVTPVGRPQAPAEPGPRAMAATVDDVWTRLIARESGGDQGAVSPKGAFGVAQIMPGTAEYVAKKMGRPELAEAARVDAGVNEMLGKAYYKELLDEFDGDHVLAAAAYNAGPGRVRRWISRFGSPDDIGRQAWINKIPIKETREYAQDVAADFIQSPAPSGPVPRAGDAAPVATARSQTVEEQGVLVPEQFKTDDQGLLVSEKGKPATTEWEVEDEIPIPKTASAVEPIAEAPQPANLDLTDRALDILRNGEKVKLDQGESLAEFLAKNGGLGKDADLIAQDAELWHRGKPFMPKLVREGGMTLGDAAVMAQERGFLPERIGEGDNRASPQDLLDAIREELGGRPRYARVDEEGTRLKELVQDLDEVLTQIGADPARMSNAELKRAIDDFYTEPDARYGASVDIDDLVFGLRNSGRMPQRDALMPQKMASTTGGLRAQPKATAIPAMDPKNVPQVEAGVARLAERLRDSLDLIHRQGRIGMKGAIGTYDRTSGVVRTKGMQELDVLAHEAGHSMEFTKRYPALLKAMDTYSPELRPLDYDPQAQRRHEGFAEFLRWYMTNPTHAESVAPGFYRAFEDALAKDAPDVLAQLQGIQNGYQAWLSAPSAAVARSMVVRPPKMSSAAQLTRLAERRGPMAAVSEFFAEGYRGIFDQLNPWKRAVEEFVDVAERNGLGDIQLPAAKDPYKLLRMMPGASNAGHMDLMHGVHGYQSTEPESVSLADALTKALGDKFTKWDDEAIDDFGAYLAGRRMIQEWKRYAAGELEQPPDQLSPEAWTQAVTDFEAAHPQWREAADMVYDWTNALWRKRMEAGLITREQYEDGLVNHPDYVPVMRDVTERTTGVGRGSSTKNAGGVKRFRGSSRQIINPIHTLMQQAYELNTLIARNDALKALDDLGQSVGPGAGLVVERIPAKDIKGSQIDAVEAMRKALEDSNLSQRDAADLQTALDAAFGDETAMVTMYKAVDTNEKGEPIVYVWRDGKKIALRLPDGKWGKDMVDALGGMTRPVRSAFINLAAEPARWLRLGVTSHPAFFFANSIRDQMRAAMIVEGYKPFIDQAGGLVDEVSQSDITRLYNRMGGAVGGLQTAADQAARGERDIQALRRRGYVIRQFSNLKAFSHATEVSETATRLGIFKGALKQAEEAGMPRWDAALEAAYKARDYMDFDRRGAWPGMAAATRVIPFLNASLQASDKEARVAGGILKFPDVVKSLLGGPPVKEADMKKFKLAVKMWTSAAALGAAGLALRAAYGDDVEYQEAADYLRDTHWVFRKPDGELAVIPKPFALASLSNLAERLYEAVALQDPVAWKRMAEGLGAVTLPASDAPIIAIPFQLADNKDSLGNPIVPEHLRDIEPKDQAGPQTSEISKAVGGWLGVSPAQIDHVIKGVGGSWARDALKISDAALRPDAPIEQKLPDTFIAGRFIRDWTRGSPSSKEFWRLVSDNGGKFAAAEGSVRKLMTDGETKEAIKRLEKMEPAARAYVMSNMFLEGDWKLAHPMIRAGRVVGVLSDLTADLQEGNIRGADLQPIELSRAERRAAVDALGKMSVAEKRNALIAAGVKGWEQKEPMQSAQYLNDIPDPVKQALAVRLGVEFKDPRMADPATWGPTWERLKPTLEGMPDATALTQAMEAKRLKGRAGAERFLRETVPAK